MRGGDGGDDCACHEESPFIYKATDFGEMIGKLGEVYLRKVSDRGGSG